MSLPCKRKAPSPAGNWWLGHVREFRGDLLGLLARSTRDLGDVVRFRLGTHVLHLINHPDSVEWILHQNS